MDTEEREPPRAAMTTKPIPRNSHPLCKLKRSLRLLLPLLLLTSCEAPASSPTPSSKGFCEGETRVAETACLIDAAARGASQSDGKSGVAPRERYRFYAALAAMNHIQTIASSARYSFLSLRADFRSPKGSEVCLLNKIGICGNHIALFEDILTRLGVKTRRVEFYFRDKNGNRASHIGAEVFFREKWNYFDVTWGTVFPEERRTNDREDKFALKSLTETLMDHSALRTNQNNEWYVFVRDHLDVFYYLEAPQRSILIGGEGTITHALPGNQVGTVQVDFSDLPDYVGDMLADGNPMGVEHRFDLKGKWDIEVSVLAKGGCEQGANLYVDAVRGSEDGTTVSFTSVADPTRLYVRSKDDVCFYRMDGLRFEREQGRG